MACAGSASRKLHARTRGTNEPDGRGEKVYRPQELDGLSIGGFVGDPDSPSLLEFTAQWCAPCMAMAPAMRDLAQVYGGRLRFGTLDVDRFPDLATKFGVVGAPTLILFCHGKELSRATGFQPAAVLRSWIADHLADC